ncbi:hypothetical protein RUM43_008427 [Polyplax serrata]|uniref:VWFA domain-containing protein n=1 Tax=Polyplax serrata TaxID=468196 RepID=A0AAN8NML0_POLSC
MDGHDVVEFSYVDGPGIPSTLYPSDFLDLDTLYAFKLPSGERFSRWNQLLELKLYDVVVTATELDFARNVYKSDTSTRVNEINGDEILKSVLRKLGNLTSSRKSALKRLVDNAEENFANFQKSNASIPNLEALSFFNVKAVEIPKTMKMAYSPHFQQVVSFDQSGVHIPLEIYDGYSQILNGLKWTTSLDEVFKENRRRDPHLKWQYFGSFFGFLRVYPAFKWPDHPSLPDLFDVRRRSWYIQSSVTPKDVIILIDRSGSVHGPTLDIMKITARALLNTLGENDYVNVAWFNNKVKWVVPCLNTLMQATAQMRRLLGDAVERLTESNLTSYTTALDFAFEEFRKFDELKKPWVGSNCHKIVMFLSDGGTEWPTDLINRHCNESRNGKIKIFTFACGPHPIPTVVLKEMACSTGGYFSPVTALGSVRVKIRDYVRVLSRPLAYSNDKDMFTWHNFYRDIGGLGMVTTVTLPVFNKLPNPSGKIVNLLGIMGVDVSVEEMTNLFPQHLMGPFGYAFSINTNGFVVFHPRLQDHIVYLEDPPNIYLTDLEGSTEEIKTMEKQIIDGTNGSLRNFRSIVPVGMGHAILVELDYFYGAIESTTFRFGIALPSNHKVLKIENLDVNEYLSYLTSLKGVLLAPWKFCGETDEDLNLGKLVQRIKQHDNSCE